jgi:hypothetical protein
MRTVLVSANPVEAIDKTNAVANPARKNNAFIFMILFPVLWTHKNQLKCVSIRGDLH